MTQEQSANRVGYVAVQIYDQTYYLAGQDTEQIHGLAEMVDARMRAVAAQGRTVDSLRVAVLAALNLADELTQAVGGMDARRVHDRAASLRGLLDEVLLDEAIQDEVIEDERRTG